VTGIPPEVLPLKHTKAIVLPDLHHIHQAARFFYGSCFYGSGRPSGSGLFLQPQSFVV